MADPVNIMELVKKADELLRACQELLALDDISDANIANAKKVGTQLLAAVDYFRAEPPFKKLPWKELHDRGRDLEKADKPDKARTAVDALEELISLEAPPKVEEPSELRQLFSNVSNSLIDAQKELNKSSLEYVDTLDARFPPTYYGIPNVKAEMRVGFNEIKSRGINLFFFTNSSQKERFAESTVSFEIMGTPPPPGPVRYGDYVVPVPRLIVVGESREKLLDQILKEGIVKGKPYENTRNKALVLRYERDKADLVSRYLVLWVSQTIDQTGPDWREVSVVYAIGRAGSDGETFEFPNENKENTIFEFPPPNRVLRLPPNKPEKFADTVPDFIAGEDPKIKLAKVSIDLGDVVMNLSEIINGWLDSVKYEPPQKVEK